MANAFSDWIEQAGLRSADVARALGVSPATVVKYRSDGYWPEKRISALRIWRFTGGAVSLDAMLADPSPKKSREHQMARKAVAEVRLDRKGKGYAPRKKSSSAKKRSKRKEAESGDSAGAAAGQRPAARSGAKRPAAE